jgi:anti-sigma28 factor (negative regulator of flagellin synthesis)
VRRKKAPAKLADIIHDGLGPIHTATSSKKRKAHTATDQLKTRLEEVENQMLTIKVQLGLYDASTNDVGSGILAEEAIEAIRDVITKGT